MANTSKASTSNQSADREQGAEAFQLKSNEKANLDKEASTAKVTTEKKTATTKKASKRKAKPLYTTDAVRAYLHEIGRVPLLSHEDEIVLGKQVQQLMALLEIKETLEAELPMSEDADESDAEEVEISHKQWAEAAGMTEAELENHLRRGQRSKRKMIEDEPSFGRGRRQKVSKAKSRVSRPDSGRNAGFGARRREV